MLEALKRFIDTYRGRPDVDLHTQSSKEKADVSFS